MYRVESMPKPLSHTPGSDGRYKVIVEINCRTKRVTDLRNVLVTGRAVASRDIAGQINCGLITIVGEEL